jgi:4a-hydroxytetrahydrobiopterin dehydratase
VTGGLTGAQFEQLDGVEDWRAIFGGGWACAHFRTGTLDAGVRLVSAIGEAAGGRREPVDVDLRPEGVTVRLYSGAYDGISEADAALARRISAAAHELGAEPAPRAVQHVQVAIDALVPAHVLPFWRAVLGYDRVGERDLVDRHRRGPTFWFQQMDAPRPQRDRFHVDVYVPTDEVQDRLDAALAAGGHLVTDANAPEWWTLADAEGNEVDLAIWMAEGDPG